MKSKSWYPAWKTSLSLSQKLVPAKHKKLAIQSNFNPSKNFACHTWVVALLFTEIEVVSGNEKPEKCELVGITSNISQKKESNYFDNHDNASFRLCIVANTFAWLKARCCSVEETAPTTWKWIKRQHVYFFLLAETPWTSVKQRLIITILRLFHGVIFFETAAV